MDELAKAREKRFDKRVHGQADLELFAYLRDNDPNRIQTLWVGTFNDVPPPNDWRAVNQVGSILHSAWWLWMDPGKEKFEESWRVEPVFSVTCTRHGWHFKQSTRFADFESTGTLKRRVGTLSWMVRTWWDITMVYAKFAASAVRKKKEQHPWQKQQ